MPHHSVIERWGADSGALPAGLRSSADAAATHLGVSRTVSRETVRVLESMGLLTVRRRIGITVQPAHRWNLYDTGILRWRPAGPDSQWHLTSLNKLRKSAEPRAAKSASSQHTATLTRADNRHVGRRHGRPGHGVADPPCRPSPEAAHRHQEPPLTALDRHPGGRQARKRRTRHSHITETTTRTPTAGIIRDTWTRSEH